jgi:hypothetical protein
VNDSTHTTSNDRRRNAEIAGRRADAAALRTVAADLTLTAMIVPTGGQQVAGLLAGVSRWIIQTGRLLESMADAIEQQADESAAGQHTGDLPVDTKDRSRQR